MRRAADRSAHYCPQSAAPLCPLPSLTPPPARSLRPPRSYRFIAEMFAVHRLSMMRRQLLALARKMLRLSLQGSILRWMRAHYGE